MRTFESTRRNSAVFRKHLTIVRRGYFQHWDRGRKWVVRRNPRRQGGVCYRNKRLIEIGPTKLENLPLILIHEICHAVTWHSHAGSWQSRMLQAAARADALGDRKLAATLRDEVDTYRRAIEITGKVTAATIYQDIKDVVLETQQPLSFREVISHVGSDYGVNYNEFLRLYPKSKAAYQQANRYLQRTKHLVAPRPIGR